LRYDEYVKEAVKYYGELEEENNELYKKYVARLDLPASLRINDPISSKAATEYSELLASDLGTSFDAVIAGDSIVYSRAKHVLGEAYNEDANIGMLENRIFKSSENKLAAFINANSRKTFLISVGRDEEAALSVLFLKNEAPVQILVDVQEGGKLELSELFASASDEAYLSTTMHEIKAGERSHANISIINDEGYGANAVSLSKGICGAGASMRINYAYSGSAVSKARNGFYACGDGASVKVSEAVYGVKNQVFDISTYISNSSRFSKARLDSGAVLDEASRCIMKGFAKVEKFTKGAESNITERGVLLSEDAKIDALPDMSIDYSDEVKATHSAASSPIDRELIFYLQSRGIEETEARKLFIRAFVDRYLEGMENNDFREAASQMLGSKLYTREPCYTSGILF
jgi:Fe-S cluster assembly protein SufD